MSAGDRATPRLADYLGNTLNEADRRAFEEELLDDPATARNLYAHLNLEAGLRESVEPHRIEWWKRKVVRIAVPLAAAAGLLLFLRVGDRTPVDEVLRGPETDWTDARPAGELDAPPAAFVWPSVPGAARYRVELFDAASNARFEVTVPDTTTTIAPAEYGAAPGAELYWRVTPLDSFGQPLPAGPPLRFRVSAP